jgi:hypothetical protein
LIRKGGETTSGNNKKRRSAARGKRVVQTCGVVERSSNENFPDEVCTREKYRWRDGCESYREQQQLAGAEEARLQRARLFEEQVTLRG